MISATWVGFAALIPYIPSEPAITITIRIHPLVMISRRAALGSIAGCAAAALSPLNGAWAQTTNTPATAAPDPENTLIMTLDAGQVVIRLRPDIAPAHVARIKELTRQGFYDGVVFHRVIPGFMAQTGDPTGTGRGGSGQKLTAELSNTPFRRGTVGMARGGSLDSADSQFFICYDRAAHLDGNYTVWGEVVDGMSVVDRIARGEPPRRPDRIVTMTVQADAATNK